MDTQVFQLENRNHYPPKGAPYTGVHANGNTETAPPKHGRTTELPRTLTWFACQAVRLDPEGVIELRSFPFFALSLEHARVQLAEVTQKEGCPYTHIFQYAFLYQESKKHTKCKLEKNSINIQTGKKL